MSDTEALNGTAVPAFSNIVDPDVQRSLEKAVTDAVANAVGQEQVQPDNAGLKFDTAKITFDLLPHEALAEVQAVLDYGKEKYAAWNWARGMKWLRLWNAAMRHMWAWVRGEDIDPESGKPHLAHAVCCLLFLITYQQRARAGQPIGEDDRSRPFFPPYTPT